MKKSGRGPLQNRSLCSFYFSVPSLSRLWLELFDFGGSNSDLSWSLLATCDLPVDLDVIGSILAKNRLFMYFTYRSVESSLEDHYHHSNMKAMANCWRYYNLELSLEWKSHISLIKSESLDLSWRLTTYFIATSQTMHLLLSPLNRWRC